VRVFSLKNYMRNESNSGAIIAASAGHNCSQERSECEHKCWDPKDGDLCLFRMKPPETVVEVRSGPDVQIGRKK